VLGTREFVCLCDFPSLCFSLLVHKPPRTTYASPPSSLSHASIHLLSKAMKTFVVEPRLNVLNEKLAANLAGVNIVNAAQINFLCESTTLYSNSNIKINMRHSAKTDKANNDKQDSVSSRTTRPQRSVRVIFWPQSGRNGLWFEIYPDIVEVDSPGPTVSCPESVTTTTTTPDGATRYQKPRCEDFVTITSEVRDSK
jgi:hypothetical protein